MRLRIMPRRPALASMSVQDLLKLRDQVTSTLSRQAAALKAQLAALAGFEESGGRPKQKQIARKSPAATRKVPPKYRDKSGNTWSGRGAQPRWMTAAIKAGTKRDDFLIAKKPAKAAKRKARR